MPTGCIKKHPASSWLRFNHLLKTVNLDDKRGHLFVIDIKFGEKELLNESTCATRFFYRRTSQLDKNNDATTSGNKKKS